MDDEEAFELSEIKEGIQGNETPRVASSTEGVEQVQLSSPVTEGRYGEALSTDEARYDAVHGVAETGNGLKLEELLFQWEERGWLRDWRNEEGLTLYADAITDGYLGKISDRPFITSI